MLWEGSGGENRERRGTGKEREGSGEGRDGGEGPRGLGAMNKFQRYYRV